MNSLRQAGIIDTYNRIVIFPNLTSTDMHKCILAHVVNLIQTKKFIHNPDNYTYTSMTCLEITDKLSLADQKEYGSRLLIQAYIQNTRSAFTI